MTDLDLPWPDIRDWAQFILSVGLLLLTAVLARATVEYTRATERMADATKEQADAARHRPYVHLFMDWRADTVGLRNIGDRVAHRVVVEVHKDFLRERGGFLEGSKLLSEPVPSIAPGDQVKESLGNTALRDGNLETVEVTVSYEDGDSHHFDERVMLRLADAAEWFRGSPPIGPSHAERELAKFRAELTDAISAIAQKLPGADSAWRS